MNGLDPDKTLIRIFVFLYIIWSR